MKRILNAIKYLHNHKEQVNTLHEEGLAIFKNSQSNISELQKIYVCLYKSDIDIFAVLGCLNKFTDLDKISIGDIEKALPRDIKLTSLYTILSSRKVYDMLLQDYGEFFKHSKQIIRLFLLNYLFYLSECNSLLLHTSDARLVMLSLYKYIDEKILAFKVFLTLNKYEDNKQMPEELLNALAFTNSSNKEGTPQQLANLRDYLNVLKNGGVEKCSIF